METDSKKESNADSGSESKSESKSELPVEAKLISTKKAVMELVKV